MITRWLSIDTQKSALLVGPRRSGKTTFLKQLFPEIPYVTLDDLDLYDWANKDPKGFIAHLGPRAMIDEIQRLPKLTIAIKYAIDNLEARFWMTGSSTAGLLDAAADSLAGRINIYHFPTVCWGEESGLSPGAVTAQLSLPNLRHAQRELENTYTFGLFPEIAIHQDAHTKKTLLYNYKSTYFTRDILQLSNLENAEGILGVYYHLIRSIGAPVEVSHLARESGLSFPSAKKYMHSLLQSDLAFKLYGYHYGPAKRFIKAAKVYFADSGIPHSFQATLSLGQQIEQFVISELEKRRKLGFIQSEALYYYKSAAGHEVDVVFEHQNKLYAIEIKAGKTPGNRDLRSLREFAANSQRPCVPILLYGGNL